MLDVHDRIFSEFSRFKYAYSLATQTEKTYYAGKFTGFLNACLIFEQLSRADYERIYASFEIYVSEK